MLLTPFHFTNTGDPSHSMHTQVFCSPSLNGHVWVGGSIKMSGGGEGLMYICMREGAKKSDAHNHNAVGIRPSQTERTIVMSA